MRYGHLLMLVAGCGFRAEVVPGEPGMPGMPGDGPDPPPDGGVAGTLMFDTAEQFAAGAALHSMTIEARGSLTPDAYTYGGLLARGYSNQSFWTDTSPTWAALVGKTPDGAGLWHGERITSQDGLFNNLEFLGITDKGNMSLTLEGEVFLEAGTDEKLHLVGDDVAFFQIAPPGTTDFGPVSDSNGNAVPVATPITGWYPIRIGHSNSSGGNDLQFMHVENNGTEQTWSRDRMRARTSTLTGTLQTVFDRQILGGGQLIGTAEVQPVSSLVVRDLLATDFDPQPQGAASDDWSARFAGQVYVAQPGEYTLTIASDNGNFGLLGSVRGGGHYTRNDNTPTTSPIVASLVEGWNDLWIDYNHVSGAKSLQVQLSGPGLANGHVSADHLRPVGSQDDRLAFGSDDSADGIKDNGDPNNGGIALLDVDGSPGETVRSIDVTLRLNATVGEQIKTDLEAPNGKSVTIRKSTSGTPDGEQFLQVRVPEDATGMLGTLLGGPVKGTWKLHVFDTSGSGTRGDSTLESVKLTLHTTGGPEKIAKTASWTSPVIDQPTEVFAIDSVTTDERVPRDATLGVFVRTCQQADCSDGTWSGPVARNTAFAVTPGRHLQLRVDMTSNGVLEPELRALNVAFRRAQ